MQFRAKPYSSEWLPKGVAAFHCGDEPWSVEVSDWLKNPDKAAQDVRNEVANVWFYMLGESLVGFGSLGKEDWILPIEDLPPDTQSVMQVQVIPYVAVATEYHSKPAGVPHAARYSNLIMGDLIGRAIARRDEFAPFLGLWVHEGNEKAARFYGHLGFQRIDKVEDVYFAMMLDLRD